MLLKEKTWQHRYDFHGIFVCEFCGSEQKEKHCYDDEYYHENVIPTKIRCKVCGETTTTGKENNYTFVKETVVFSEETQQLLMELEKDYRFSELVGSRAQLFKQALELYTFYYEEVLKTNKHLYTGYTVNGAEEIRIVDGKFKLVRENRKQ